MVPSHRAGRPASAARSRPRRWSPSTSGSTSSAPVPRNSRFLTTAAAGSGAVSPSGPATGVQAIQNSAPATAQHVPGLAASSRTGPNRPGEATTTASAIPAQNQPANAGSHRFSGPTTWASVSTHSSQPAPAAVSAPSPASTRPGRQPGPVACTSQRTSTGSSR